MGARTIVSASVLLALTAGPAAADDYFTAEIAGREAAGTDSSWTAPRTEWGDPDLRGTWPIDSVGRTPMQRAPSYGDRALMTDAEYEEALEAADTVAANYELEDAEDTIGSGHWFEWGRPLRQTSLIVEPANGRIPPLTDVGLERAANMKSSWSEAIFEDISDFNALDRCITRGLPASMIPFPYNNGIQVFQSPGYVVLRLEMVHETRIVPLDGRPHPPGQIEHWLGEPRGHWDGDSLVIETANFNGQFPMVIVGPSNEPIPTSRSMRMTERLTPTGPDTIYYEAWIEDPEVLTEPFKMAFPWTRDEEYQPFEYACHEGNTVVPYYIQSTSPRFVEIDENVRSMSAEEWINLTVDR